MTCTESGLELIRKKALSLVRDKACAPGTRAGVREQVYTSKTASIEHVGGELLTCLDITGVWQSPLMFFCRDGGSCWITCEGDTDWTPPSTTGPGETGSGELGGGGGRSK